MRLFKSELIFTVKDLWFLGKDKTEIRKTLKGEKKEWLTYISVSSAALRILVGHVCHVKFFLNTEFLNTSLLWVTLLTMNSSVSKHDKRDGTYFGGVRQSFSLTFYVYLLRFSFISKSVYNSLIHTTLIHWDEQLMQANLHQFHNKAVSLKMKTAYWCGVNLI